MLALLLVAQAAPVQLPDIEINARVRARELSVEQRGEAQLRVRAEPFGAERVEIDAPRLNGQTTLSNVTVDLHASATISDEPANALDREPQR